MNYLILLPIIAPIIFGFLIRDMKQHSDADINGRAVLFTVLTSVLALTTLYLCYGKSLTILRFNDVLSLSFTVDGLGAIFASLVSILWPFAVVYATKYMDHEGQIRKFFTFYTMTFGVVIGIALSGNMITMYLFYEALSFITLPLVSLHDSARDRYAGKIYIFYAVGGAAISFMGMMVFMAYVGTWDFNLFSSLNVEAENYVYISYILMFIGFSVKAGIFPFHRWLIAAGVAPTPVTALLHAVAVVKSGIFATMRVTYYLFDPEYLNGTVAQYFTMTMAIITIIFGSSMAMKNKHLKRRFAYSTVSQLSYILLGVTAMSTMGLTAALLQMIFHAFIKIVIFYTAGNVLYVTHKEFARELEGFGLRMKTTFLCFSISSLALIGIPPFGGFIAKFSLAQSVVTSVGGELGFFAVAALMISALLTAMYLLQIVAISFLPQRSLDISHLPNVHEAPKQMVIPLICLTSIMVILSLFSADLLNFIELLLSGGFNS